MGRGWGERSSEMRGAAGFLQPVLTLGESRSHPDRASRRGRRAGKKMSENPEEQEQELPPAPGASFPNLPWERRSVTVGGGGTGGKRGTPALVVFRGDIHKCICVTSGVGKVQAGECLNQQMSWRARKPELGALMQAQASIWFPARHAGRSCCSWARAGPAGASAGGTRRPEPGLRRSCSGVATGINIQAHLIHFLFF